MKTTHLDGKKKLNKTRDKKTCYVSGCSGASYKVTKLASNSEQIPGTLAHPESEQSLLSFFHLVGCTYFRKHKAAFLPMYQTPMSVFHSLSKLAWRGVRKERAEGRKAYNIDQEAIREHNSRRFSFPAYL